MSDIKDGETICGHGNRPLECRDCRIIEIPSAHPKDAFEQWWDREAGHKPNSLVDAEVIGDFKHWARKAFDAGVAQSRNYIASDEVRPVTITFANGRRVGIVRTTDITYLDVSG